MYIITATIACHHQDYTTPATPIPPRVIYGVISLHESSHNGLKGLDYVILWSFHNIHSIRSVLFTSVQSSPVAQPSICPSVHMTDHHKGKLNNDKCLPEPLCGILYIMYVHRSLHTFFISLFKYKFN